MGLFGDDKPKKSSNSAANFAIGMSIGARDAEKRKQEDERRELEKERKHAEHEAEKAARQAELAQSKIDEKAREAEREKRLGTPDTGTDD